MYDNVIYEAQWSYYVHCSDCTAYDNVYVKHSDRIVYIAVIALCTTMYYVKNTDCIVHIAVIAQCIAMYNVKYVDFIVLITIIALCTTM